MTTIGDDFPNQQERIQQCKQNGLGIGPSGTFYVMMCDDLLRRADKAAISGDIIEIIRVYNEMKEFKE